MYTILNVNNSSAQVTDSNDLFYQLNYNGELQSMVLCGRMFEALTNESIYGPSYEIHHKNICEHLIKDLKEALPLVFGELGKKDFQEFFNKEIHWDCGYNEGDDIEDFLLIKPLYEQIKTKSQYPKNPKEKIDMILLKLKQEQNQDGGQIKFLNEFKYWGKLYLLNNNELKFYLDGLEKKGLINIDRSFVSLTFDGLECVEHISEVPKLETRELNVSNGYEIALSFAGEQREYVEKVANFLSEKEIKVFYDKYEKVSLWGKDLYQHLNDIYKNKCKYCIIFVSSDYERKLWTNHELKSAQTRAFEENREYILPVKFDDTEIPGLNKTVGYIDANRHSPQEIAELVFEKIRSTAV